MISRIIALLVLATLSAGASIAQDAPGRISGVVRNKATGLFLRDATVELHPGGRTAATDELGRFSFSALSHGLHTITVSYMGLEPFQRTVEVSAHAPAPELDIQLTDPIYHLEAFVVSGEREGAAAAITRQRNADNVKTVVALDSFGFLPNEDPSDLLIRLPGVNSEEAEQGTVGVRGIDSSRNLVTYDGAQMATSFGMISRQFRFLNISASSFEELEVIKAPTPNMWASSLGGTINMKTKTTLNMRENRQFTYRAGFKLSPSLFDYTPRRVDSPFGPIAALGYKQLFSIGSGRRNLGVSLELFHSKYTNSIARTDTEYAPTLGNAYIYRFKTLDNADYRTTDSATLRFDYKYSKSTRFYVSALFSQAKSNLAPGLEGMNTDFRANPNSASAYAPGYNEDCSTIATGGIMQIIQGYLGFLDRQTRVQIGGEHKYSFLELDYDFTYSNSSVDLDGGGNAGSAGNQLIAQLWNITDSTLDRTHNAEFPSYTYAGTTPATNPYKADNYTDLRLYHRQGTRDGTNYEAKINAKANIDLFGRPVQLSSGLAWQQIGLGENPDTRQWRYKYSYNAAGSGSLASDYAVAQFLDPGIKIDSRFGAGITELPRFHIGLVSDDLRDNPDNWWHNEYYYLQDQRNNTRNLKENIYAAYLMGRTRFGKLGVLAGARMEYTEFDGEAWERAKTPAPTTVEQVTDPFGSIESAYGMEKKQTHNSYADVFPGIHFTYAFQKNFLARASWSTSIGRPPPRQLISTFSYNDTSQSVTISNPDLKPEYANNFDLSLEYYLKPVGLFSIGAFRKEISDFIYSSRGKTIGPDDGYPDFLDGYTENMHRNGGDATINGLEISYEQQLSFLPRPFKELRINLNYTWMDMDASYDAGVPRTTADMPNFVPATFNARLRYHYKRLWCGVAFNYTDSKLVTYSDNPAYLEYRKGRHQIDLNASFRIKSFLEFFATVNNITDEPYVNYIGKESRNYRTIYNGPNLNIGISGRF